MDNLKTIIIYTSMIDRLIKEFKLQESNNAINDIKRVTTNFLKVRNRKNPKIFLEAIQLAHEAWKDSLNHYAEKDYKIDIYSLINGLWCEQEDLFKKFTALNHRRIEKFLMSSDNLHTTEQELQAYQVSSYLIEQIKKQGK